MEKKRLFQTPIWIILLGMAGTLAVILCLFFTDFKWFDLVYYVPALGVSALFIFGGKAKLKRMDTEKPDK